MIEGSAPDGAVGKARLYIVCAYAALKRRSSTVARAVAVFNQSQEQQQRQGAGASIPHYFFWLTRR
jgi:hypothetical protein